MKKAALFALLVVFVFPMFAVDKSQQVVTDPEALPLLAKQAMKGGNPDAYNQAARYFAQLIIRIRIDGACCADPSVRNVKSVLTRMGWTSEDNESFHNKVSNQRFYHFGTQQVEHISRALQGKTLSSPHWIGKFKEPHFYKQYKQTPTEPEPYFYSDVFDIIRGGHLTTYKQLIAEANQKLAGCSCA